MAFLTELHLHTSEVSPCGQMTAKETADLCIKGGYHTVVVCNHYCDYVMESAGENWQTRFDHFVSGYRTMRDYAGDRLCVLLGAELRFTECMNDYLVFGLDEQFLLDHPNLHHMTLKNFYPLAQENGLMIVQAHPFRHNMKIMPPSLLDGYEVFNGHPGHDSRNDIARLWCKKYQKLPTSGSDLHDLRQLYSGGIYTEERITSTQQLVRILKSGSYKLRCRGRAADRDGIQDFDACEL